jgi:hypothetical protein
VPEGSLTLGPLFPSTLGPLFPVREYSDTLLIFLLKAACPEKYRDRYYRSVSDERVPSSAGYTPSVLLERITENATTRRLMEQILTLLDQEGGAA